MFRPLTTLLLLIGCFPSLRAEGRSFNGSVTPIYAFSKAMGSTIYEPVAVDGQKVYGVTSGEAGVTGDYGVMYKIEMNGNVSIAANMTKADAMVGGPLSGFVIDTVIFFASCDRMLGNGVMLRFDTTHDVLLSSVKLSIKEGIIQGFLPLADSVVLIGFTPQAYTIYLQQYSGSIKELYSDETCGAASVFMPMVYTPENKAICLAFPNGGDVGSGRIVKIDNKGKVKIVHDFAGYDGVAPWDLVDSGHGYLYGGCISGADETRSLFMIDLKDDSFISLIAFAPNPFFAFRNIAVDIAGNAYVVGTINNQEGSAIWYYDFHLKNATYLTTKMQIFYAAPIINDIMFGTIQDNTYTFLSTEAYLRSMLLMHL